MRFHLFPAPSQHPRRSAFLATSALILTMAVAGSSWAQDAGDEPPALVGRIAGIQGDVSMHRGDQQDWSQAGVNEPVTVGDAVYAAEAGDARLQIGATDFDLKSDSEIDIAALDQNAGSIRLDSGTVDLRVSALPTADGLSILTPRGTVQLLQPGLYRIESGSEDAPTRVSAWQGQAQLGQAVTVQAGQALLITGTADAPQYSFGGEIGPPPDSWRDPAHVVTAATRYISPEMTGAEDMYRYGSFQTVADYGAVWYPSEVPADWQPYRYGHWEYVAPWGQTWIDDQPWGFAPFHYGRWAYIASRWGWVPGAYEAHPVYAPALVAFVGGSGFSASISFGGGEAVGWVPLAPGELYRPYYRASPTYIQNINRTVIVNRTVINNTVINEGGPATMAGFANRRFATVAPADVIARGRPVGQAVIKVNPQQIEQARVDQQTVVRLRPTPGAVRPAAHPGPVTPTMPRERAAPAARPALLPARGNGPAAASPGMGRPANPPRAVPPPAPIPPRPGMPNMGRPAPERPGVPPRPDNRAPEAPRPPERTQPAAPREEHAPAPPRPEAAPRTERPAPLQAPRAERPQAPAPRPDATPRMERPAAPEAPRAERPQAPAPRPDAAPRMERPAARTPRPEAPRAEAPRVERPQAPAPRPEPRPQAAPPAPAPHPAPAKAPPKPDEQNKQ